jgi:ABC-2 type transport system permease protein
MRALNLILNEIRMLGWSLKRYLFNTGATLVVMYVIFLGLFWGVKSMAGPGVDAGSLDLMVVGYVLWLSAMMALQSTGAEVLSESERGTLEQLYLSPLGAEMVFLGRTICNILFNFVFLTVMLYLSMLTTGRMLTIELLYFYPVLFASLVSLIGISFMLGGIGLIHKRIGALNAILSFGLIGMMLLPVYPLTPWSFLPFLAGASAINEHTVNGTTYPAWWYLFIFGNSFFYLVLGLGVFRIFERRAMKLNKLGQY